jgi:integrase
LRRTHATLMDATGARDLREQLGHASDEMTEHYIRKSFDDHQSQVMRLAALVMGTSDGGRKM